MLFPFYLREFLSALSQTGRLALAILCVWMLSACDSTSSTATDPIPPPTDEPATSTLEPQYLQPIELQIDNNGPTSIDGIEAIAVNLKNGQEYQASWQLQAVDAAYAYARNLTGGSSGTYPGALIAVLHEGYIDTRHYDLANTIASKATIHQMPKYTFQGTEMVPRSLGIEAFNIEQYCQDLGLSDNSPDCNDDAYAQHLFDVIDLDTCKFDDMSQSCPNSNVEDTRTSAGTTTAPYQNDFNHATRGTSIIGTLVGSRHKGLAGNSIQETLLTATHGIAYGASVYAIPYGEFRIQYENKNPSSQLQDVEIDFALYPALLREAMAGPPVPDTPDEADSPPEPQKPSFIVGLNTVMNTQGFTTIAAMGSDEDSQTIIGWQGKTIARTDLTQEDVNMGLRNRLLAALSQTHTPELRVDTGNGHLATPSSSCKISNFAGKKQSIKSVPGYSIVMDRHVCPGEPSRSNEDIVARKLELKHLINTPANQNEVGYLPDEPVQSIETPFRKWILDKLQTPIDPGDTTALTEAWGGILVSEEKGQEDASFLKKFEDLRYLTRATPGKIDQGTKEELFSQIDAQRVSALNLRLRQIQIATARARAIRKGLPLPKELPEIAYGKLISDLTDITAQLPVVDEYYVYPWGDIEAEGEKYYQHCPNLVDIPVLQPNGSVEILQICNGEKNQVGYYQSSEYLHSTAYLESPEYLQSIEYLAGDQSLDTTIPVCLQIALRDEYMAKGNSCLPVPDWMNLGIDIDTSDSLTVISYGKSLGASAEKGFWSERLSGCDENGDAPDKESVCETWQETWQSIETASENGTSYSKQQSWLSAFWSYDDTRNFLDFFSDAELARAYYIWYHDTIFDPYYDFYEEYIDLFAQRDTPLADKQVFILPAGDNEDQSLTRSSSLLNKGIATATGFPNPVNIHNLFWLDDDLVHIQQIEIQDINGEVTATVEKEISHLLLVVAIGPASGDISLNDVNDGIQPNYGEFTAATKQNYCGDASRHCITAPGFHIQAPSYSFCPVQLKTDGSLECTKSLAHDVGAINDFGSEMAAAIVAGSLALMEEHTRGMVSGIELVEKLKETAIKENFTGSNAVNAPLINQYGPDPDDPQQITKYPIPLAADYSDSEKYGQGLVNLKGALTALGTEVIVVQPLIFGASSPLNTSQFGLYSRAFGDGLMHGLASHTFMALDELRFPFFYSLGQLATQNYGSPITPLMYSHTSTMSAGDSNSTLFERISLLAGNQAIAPAFRMSTGSWELGFAAELRPVLLTDQFSAGPGAAALRQDTPWMMPWLDRNAQWQSATIALALPTGQLRLSACSANASSVADNGTAHFSGGDSSCTLLEYNIQLKQHQLGAMMGSLEESQGLLGLHPVGGAGQLNGGNSMNYGVWGRHDLGSDWKLVWALATIKAQNRQAQGGILQHTGAMTADNFSFALGLPDHGGTRIWLQIYQPLRIRTAHADLKIPIARDRYGDMYFNETSVSLSPSGRELRTELLYDLPLEGSRLGGRLQLLLGHSHEPGHVRHNPSTEYLQLGFHLPLR